MCTWCTNIKCLPYFYLVTDQETEIRFSYKVALMENLLEGNCSVKSLVHWNETQITGVTNSNFLFWNALRQNGDTLLLFLYLSTFLHSS